MWAAPWLGSEVDYGRTALDGSVYLPVGSRSVLAATLRAGTFIGAASVRGGEDFIPPEDRFYAGGANSVRGYARNTLGPGVYVEEGPQFEEDNVVFVPIGGLSALVTSLELRFLARSWATGYASRPSSMRERSTRSGSGRSMRATFASRPVSGCGCTRRSARCEWTWRTTRTRGRPRPST